MKGRSIGALGTVIAALMFVAACQQDCKKSATSGGPAASTADPDPHWVIQQSPRAKVALVYVHGVTGDMVGTWTASNGKTFFDLVNENPATKGKADAFVFGFPSFLFTAGSFDIREAANRLHLQLKTPGRSRLPGRCVRRAQHGRARRDERAADESGRPGQSARCRVLRNADGGVAHR